MLYPINLQLRDKLCLVVGGGQVGLRKLKGLLAAGARVRLVSPTIATGIEAFLKDEALEWRERAYRAEDLHGVLLAFVATNEPETQERIAHQAAAAGVLVNNATSPENSDFHLPAAVRRGELLLTVSTGGSSPALAKLLRHQLEDQFAEGYSEVLQLLALLRREILAWGMDQAQNHALFHRLLQSGLVELVLAKDWPAVERVLKETLPREIKAAEVLTELARRCE